MTTMSDSDSKFTIIIINLISELKDYIKSKIVSEKYTEDEKTKIVDEFTGKLLSKPLVIECLHSWALSMRSLCEEYVPVHIIYYKSLKSSVYREHMNINFIDSLVLPLIETLD